ncbi:hypothetical protein KKB64_00025 [Patescibacteria group bacterium]|nr:hypothetical protein [Patescibacteria group bacterium]MBU1472161.1 hypothetical protein [Patescibacteria group bacterium]MBU2459555.1 hypothetical protein [Patescibacteria group bacterium]MBU2544204.1 hypothetical protein [Patescibacteria group bacterium]
MISGRVIVIAFNAKLSDGCDYTTQTLRLLGKSNVVYGLALGEPVSWRGAIKNKGRVRLIERRFQSVLIHPFFLIPGQRFMPIKTANHFLNALVLRFIIGVIHRGKRKIFWFFEPFHMVPLYLVFLGYVSLYDCIDYYKDLGFSWSRPEKFLLKKASIIVCNSQTLAEIHRKTRKNIHVVPLGFASEEFGTPSKRVKQSELFTVGYIGGINYRLDFPLLFRLVALLPGVQFVFAGPVQVGLVPNEGPIYDSLTKLFSYSNVRYVGELPKTKMQGVVRSFHAAIIPYDLSRVFNQYCYPMKIMEFFWCGVPVVATPIRELQRLSPYVLLGKTAPDFAKHIRLLQSQGWSYLKQRQQRKIANVNSWKHKIEAIENHMDASVFAAANDDPCHQQTPRKVNNNPGSLHEYNPG